jgi:hypothetical protein
MSSCVNQSCNKTKYPGSSGIDGKYGLVHSMSCSTKIPAVFTKMVYLRCKRKDGTICLAKCVTSQDRRDPTVISCKLQSFVGENVRYFVARLPDSNEPVSRGHCWNFVPSRSFDRARTAFASRDPLALHEYTEFANKSNIARRGVYFVNDGTRAIIPSNPQEIEPIACGRCSSCRGYAFDAHCLVPYNRQTDYALVTSSTGQGGIGTILYNLNYHEFDKGETRDILDTFLVRD